MEELLHHRVRWNVEGPVATATLARPDAGNGFDLPMAEGILAAARRLAKGAEEGSIRAGVIQAEGKVFSVGGDLQHFADSEDRGAQMRQVAGALHEALRLIAGTPLPVITVIHGVAAGGGVGLALAGDVVLAGPKAKFRLAYTAGGLSPDCGTSWVLPQRVGLARALDLALTNRVVEAEEAERWGLVSRLVDVDDLSSYAADLAAELAAGAKQALGQAKRLVRAGVEDDFATHLDDEGSTIAALVAGTEGREGVDAFLAKRTPRFV